MWSPFLDRLENSFIPFFLVIWLLRNLAELLFLLAVFQLKEYRLDRIRSYLTTFEGKRLFLNRASLLKWLLLLSSIGLLFSEKYRLVFFYLVLIFYLSELVFFLNKKLNLEYKRPTVTVRVLLLATLCTGLEISIIALFAYLGDFGSVRFSKTSFSLLTLVLDKALPLLIMGANVVTLPLVALLKRKAIFQAKRKLRKFENLIVIGITGSYGKTSAKYFLSEILKSRYRVFYTKGSNNTAIGIAQEILKNLKSPGEIFVVEMGAYKRGEIKTICDLVKPKVGVITALGDSHLALFGSRENIARAKFELLDALAENGRAVLNGDEVEIVRKSGEYGLKKRFYSLKGPADLYATNLVLGKRYIRFKVISGEESEDFEVRVLGLHNISNILAAVGVAEGLGLNLSEIAKAARKIEPPPQTMAPVRGLRTSYFIDDTFNVNPRGVQAALAYLAATDWQKKILVVQPLIELGKEAGAEHVKLGRLMGNICDLVYFTNQDYKEFIQQGYKSSKKRALLFWKKNRREIARDLIEKVQGKDVVLFEGKESAVVLNLLRKRG